MNIERVRASISAMVSEAEVAHRYLGIGCDDDERREVLEVIARIERQLNETGIEGDRKWSPKAQEVG